MAKELKGCAIEADAETLTIQAHAVARIVLAIGAGKGIPAMLLKQAADFLKAHRALVKYEGVGDEELEPLIRAGITHAFEQARGNDY